MYAGVNPVETYIREGQYSRLPELPFVPGCDAAGYVEAVGEAVHGLKVQESCKNNNLNRFLNEF